MKNWLLAGSLVLAAAGAPTFVLASPGSSATSDYCDQTQSLSAGEQDGLLQFAAVVREELGKTEGRAALISRSGLDLSRFRIRYSHAAVAWRSESDIWTARQLYFACDLRRPQLYDQGIAGFTMGTNDPKLGYISIVRLPADAANKLQRTALDQQLALHLLASNYSANAYAYGLQYQNCNQWLLELLAAAWGGLNDGDDLRARAQSWLRYANYAPKPVDVDSVGLMLASYFVPLLHLSDHPEEDRFQMKLKISLPSTIETFVQIRFPDSERVEICHNTTQIVVHRGWAPISEGCRPGAGDRVISLE